MSTASPASLTSSASSGSLSPSPSPSPSPSQALRGDGDGRGDGSQSEDDVWSPGLRHDIFMGHSSSMNQPTQNNHLPPLHSHYSNTRHNGQYPTQPSQPAILEPVTASHPPNHITRINSLHTSSTHPPTSSEPQPQSAASTWASEQPSTRVFGYSTASHPHHPSSPWSWDERYRPGTPYPRESPSHSPSPNNLTLHSDFLKSLVDLTGESPVMPSRRHHSQTKSTRPLSSCDTSTSASNPAKRRRTGPFPTETRTVEEIDLRDADDDHGLSKVLEQQRMATVKAQQEQADKPVTMSTLQCIICMELMKDITATSCGTLPRPDHDDFNAKCIDLGAG